MEWQASVRPFSEHGGGITLDTRDSVFLRRRRDLAPGEVKRKGGHMNDRKYYILPFG